MRRCSLKCAGGRGCRVHVAIAELGRGFGSGARVNGGVGCGVHAAIAGVRVVRSLFVIVMRNHSWTRCSRTGLVPTSFMLAEPLGRDTVFVCHRVSCNVCPLPE